VLTVGPETLSAMAELKPDAEYQIRTHLLYELKWMIHAAERLESDDFVTGDDVAFVNSATVCGRNLLEFAYEKKTDEFTLASLGGTPTVSPAWIDWANNRVTHLGQREIKRPPWPDGLNNDMPDRLMKMAGAVLDQLEAGGASIPPDGVKDAYDEVLRAARVYWSDPSPANHQALAALYDDSGDHWAY
jgi:hypothetical protein